MCLQPVDVDLAASEISILALMHKHVERISQNMYAVAVASHNQVTSVYISSHQFTSIHNVISLHALHG